MNLERAARNKMIRVLTLEFEEHEEESYRGTATALVARNRLWNRDAIEAAERTQRFFDSIGGFEAFERM